MTHAPFAEAWPRIPARALRHFSPEVMAEAFNADAENRGACLLCEDGVLAVKTESDDNGGTRLFVLVAAGAPGAFGRTEADVIDLARRFNCTAVAFKTHRARAWRKVLGPEWAQTDDEFSRSLR